MVKRANNMITHLLSLIQNKIIQIGRNRRKNKNHKQSLKDWKKSQIF